ncbi:MAG: hypothetical protein FWE54_00715 [Methanimicrococcus sp.]|nr:hypothetical protein [Methanimicrococcus sp.]
MSLDNHDDDGYGFFGNIENAWIYNLNLVFQGNVTSEFNNTGALAGKVGLSELNDYGYGSISVIIVNCTVKSESIVKSESHTTSKEKKAGEFIKNAINCIVQSIKHLFSGEKKAGVPIENMENDTLESKGTSISGENDVGGLVGNLADGLIYNCSSDFSVIAKKDNAGGLVGYIYTGSVINSSASGPVEAKGENAGGLVGYIQHGNASHMNDYFGSRDITITNSYATNSVQSQGYAGGLIGYISNFIIIGNSSASGPVDPPGKFGDFIGGWDEGNKPEVNNCFYQDEEVDLTAMPS